MVRNAKTLVSNRGKSRAGEKRKNPKKKSDSDPKLRKLETVKQSEKRVVDNLEHEKNGLYECGQCLIVKPESLFPQHVPTSGKFSRYGSCEKCLNTLKEVRVLSRVTQKNRDRTATRSLRWQWMIKVSLQGKAGFKEYEAECDTAHPSKNASRIRCTQKEMEETLALVGHGLVECILSHCFF